MNDFNHTSAHARVFDSVRTARFRAFADSTADEPDQTCVFDTAPAAVLWVHGDNGEITPLCRAHANSALDTVYGTGEHPPVVVPLKARRKA
jgi:hypothetical protein